MRAHELLTESMTMWIPDAPRKTIERPCALCDGEGKTFNGQTCHFCQGTGVFKDEESEGPEINMSNSNARAVMAALGFEPDEGYIIKPEQIPDLKRRIMQLLNVKDATQQYTRPGSDTQVDKGMVHTKDPLTGLDKIERQHGPRMIDSGIDQTYILGRLREVLNLLNYAQKMNAEVVVT